METHDHCFLIMPWMSTRLFSLFFSHLNANTACFLWLGNMLTLEIKISLSGVFGCGPIDFLEVLSILFMSGLWNGWALPSYLVLYVLWKPDIFNDGVTEVIRFYAKLGSFQWKILLNWTTAISSMLAMEVQTLEFILSVKEVNKFLKVHWISIFI